MEKRQLDYFYGSESEQFTFYRIPKLLFTAECYRNMNCEAKILYGLILDRMGLSRKHGWLDQAHRVYIIFSIDEIMELLGVGNKKAGNLLAELEAAGLVEKKRQGQGKPNLIYPKNFIMTEKKQKNPFSEKKDFRMAVEDFRNVEMTGLNPGNRLPESRGDIQATSEIEGNPDIVPMAGASPRFFQKCQNDSSKDVKTAVPEVSFRHGNKIENNKTEYNDPFPSVPESFYGVKTKRKESGSSAASRYLAYERLIRKQIGYECFKNDQPDAMREVDEIVALMAEVCYSKKNMIRIAGEDRPASVVRGCFLKLNHEHITLVLKGMHENTTKIRNIKQYLLAVLYNSVNTLNSYYRALVNHDMNGSRGP